MDPTAALQARLPTNLRSAGDRVLTVDTSVRHWTLTAGGWRVYGSETQVFVMTRFASDAAGTLSTGEEAPTTGQLSAAAAGSPGAGEAWDDGETVTGIPLPLETDQYEEIAVATGGHLNLYVRAASGTTVRLLGPFT